MNKVILFMSFLMTLGLGHQKTLPQSISKIIVDCNNISSKVDILNSFKIDYIPLESIPGSFIKRIEKAVFENDKILIWDKRQSAVFLFNKSGEFITNKKSVSHPGPGEFLYCYDIDIENSEIYLLSYKEVLVYNLDFNFIKKIPLPNAYEKFIVKKNWGYFYNHDQTIFDREKVGSLNFNKPQESYKLLYEDRKLGSFNLVNPINFSLRLNDVYFSYPFSDTIYQINKSSAKPLFVIKFNGRKYPAKAFDNISSYPGGPMKLMQDLQKKKSAFWPTDLILNNHFVYFSFILDGKFHYFYKSLMSSSHFLTSSITLDGEIITPVVTGFSEDKLILNVNPWQLSNKIKALIEDQHFKIEEDSNPILLFLSEK